jgi:integrase/recombinase XerD
MTGRGKEAKVLTDTQVRALVRHVAHETEAPERNTVIVLLSFKAGLRAKEVAMVRWRMVLDAEGHVGDVLRLENGASKGRSGRPEGLHPELRAALVALQAIETPEPNDFIVRFRKGSRDAVTRSNTVQWLFRERFSKLGYHGASSHSGRRTFITNLARRISQHGGSLRDVQSAAGHVNLQTTQRYIDGNPDALRKAIDSL